MSIPALIVQNNGVGVASDDNMNTWVQGGALLANLRAFVGVSSMTVWTVGTTTSGDGGQGMFVWNAGATAADDGGVTTIAPNGLITGRWIRQSGNFGAITTVPNIAALRSLVSGQTPVWVQGYYTAGDGGEGMFVTGTSATDNGGTIVVTSNGMTYYRETGGESFLLSWFGALPNGSDCAPAMNAALVALPSGIGGRIRIGSGTWTFASEIVFTYPTGVFGLSLTGNGADTTNLYWPSTDGVNVTANNARNWISVRDLSIVTGASSFTGIAIENTVQGSDFAANDFTNVTFRGSDGGAQTLYWGLALKVVGFCQVNYTGLLVYGSSTGSPGTGVTLAGIAASGHYSLIHNFTDCTWLNVGLGVEIVTYVQGIIFNQCDFTNGASDIEVAMSAIGTTQLAIVASQFAGESNRIVIQGPCAGLLMSANLIYVATGMIGLAVNGVCIQTAITGNSFVGNTTSGTFGVVMNSASNGTIVGNSFWGFNTAVDLSSTSSGWNVQSNSYANNTNNTANAGTNVVGGGSQ